MNTGMRKKQMRPRIVDSAVSAIDSYVGSRIRLRRAIVGYSQERLAEEMGITFQQVQKYERGLNRVSAGRLWKLAKILGVSVNFFFEDMDDNFQSTIPAQIGGALCCCEEAPPIEDNVLERRDVLKLVRYYLLISDPKVAKNIVDLVKSLTPISDVNSSEEIY